MKKLGVYAAALAITALSYTQANAGADYGTEGGGNHTCITSNLPANVWTLIAYDNAGQPCATKPDADQTCDATATWDWQMHGTMIFSNLSKTTNPTVRTQVWVGAGPGACYGSTSDPVFCDNPSYHYLMEIRSTDYPRAISTCRCHLNTWFT